MHLVGTIARVLKGPEVSKQEKGVFGSEKKSLRGGLGWPIRAGLPQEEALDFSELSAEIQNFLHMQKPILGVSLLL